MSDITVYSNGEDGPRVLIRDGAARASIVIVAGRQSLALSPSWAAQAASGIDEALKKITRTGQVRSNTPAGSAENGDAPPRQRQGV